MFRSKALCSLKSIFPPIHQPLPLSKRESEQLLQALTSSFRRHLDREHGWTPDDVPISSTLHPTLTYLPSSHASSSSSSAAAAAAPSPPLATTALPLPPTTSTKDAYRRPTDRHLRAILANPLFSYDSSRPGRDPADFFDEAVAKGLMTIKRAHGFLLAVRKDVQQSASLSMRDGMKASGAGLRVVRWLRASGHERNLSFVAYSRFTEILVQFMVAEGLDDLVWAWMGRVMMRHGDPAVHPARSAVLVESFVDSKAQSVELDEAFLSILRAEDIVRASSASPLLLLQAWRKLAWKTTVESWKHSPPPERLFDLFVDIPENMAYPARPVEVERAHLDLHHPANPDHVRAVDLLSNTTVWEDYVPKAVAAWKAKGQNAVSLAATGSIPNFVTKLMSMGLDTVQHLTKVGDQGEAQRILEILRTHLGAYFEQNLMPPRHIATAG